MPEQRDIVVVGAGPSGSIAAALLKRRGWDVLALEAQQFPRFSIGRVKAGLWRNPRTRSAVTLVEFIRNDS